METQTLEGVATETENAPEMVKVLVEKRDGRVVDFDPINIISAVKSAFADLDKKIGPQEERLIRDIANQVEAEIKDRYNGPAKIEDIQNLVEHGLIEDHLYDVARTYTNYRLNKDIERAKATDINEAVRRLVDRDEALVRENANKDSNVYSTQRDLLARRGVQGIRLLHAAGRGVQRPHEGRHPLPRRRLLAVHRAVQLLAAELLGYARQRASPSATRRWVRRTASPSPPRRSPRS